jgi:hypothetical protein
VHPRSSGAKVSVPSADVVYATKYNGGSQPSSAPLLLLAVGYSLPYVGLILLFN